MSENRVHYVTGHFSGGANLERYWLTATLTSEPPAAETVPFWVAGGEGKEFVFLAPETGKHSLIMVSVTGFQTHGGPPILVDYDIVVRLPHVDTFFAIFHNQPGADRPQGLLDNRMAFIDSGDPKFIESIWADMREGRPDGNSTS